MYRRALSKVFVKKESVCKLELKRVYLKNEQVLNKNNIDKIKCCEEV